GHGARDEQPSQISIALLGDPAEVLLAASGMLLGNQSDPGRQASSGRELLPISHFSDQGGGDDRTNTGDLLEPLAFFARAMPGMDVLLEHSDLCRDYSVLAGKNIETEPRGCRNPTVLLVSNDLEQLGCAVAPLRRDNAELGHMPTDRV